MAGSRIVIGFPSPNYIVETIRRDAPLPGVFVIETGSVIPPPAGAAVAYSRLLAPDEGEEPGWFPRPRAVVPVALPTNHWQSFWRFHPPEEEDDAQLLAQMLSARRVGETSTTVPVIPPPAGATVAYSRLLAPDEGEEPGWFPRPRAVVAVALPAAQASSFERFRPPHDDDEPGWYPPRRAIVPVALPTNHWQSFWRFHPPEEDDDAQLLAQMLSARRVGETRNPVPRPQVALVVT